MNRIQSSRRLERETGRNVELMWLLSRLTPDFRTIADFRKDSTRGIKQVCREFVVLCRKLDPFSQSLVAIDGSKFKVVNNRKKNFTPAKIKSRLQQIDAHIARYLGQIESADRGYYSGLEIKDCEESGIETYVIKSQTSGNQAQGYFGKRDFIYHPKDDEYECPAGERAIYRLTQEESGKQIRRY